MVNESIQNGFYHIKLSRPDVRNAFNPDMIQKLTQAFKKVNHEKDIKGVVIEGEGSVFCAGADLAWMQSLVDSSFDQNKADAEKLHALFHYMWNVEVPIVACVQGAAYGGALGLLANADFVVCEEKAQLCFSEVKLGIAPAVISEFIFKKCNISLVSNWMMSGMPFTPNEGMMAGLVHKVVPSDRLQSAKEDYLKHLHEAGPEAVRATKKLLREMSHLKEKDIFERTTSLIAFLRASQEGQEGLKGFLEKRKPSWRTI